MINKSFEINECVTCLVSQFLSDTLELKVTGEVRSTNTGQLIVEELIVSEDPN